MESPTTTDPHDSTPTDDAGSGTLGAVFDAIVALLIAIPGISAAAAGVAVWQTADRELSEAIVADMEVTSTLVSESVLVDAINEMMVWGAGGLVLTGAALTVVGIAVLVYYRRLRRGGDGGVVPTDRLALVVLGAVVSTVASFVPFSPVLGGGVAGYFQQGSPRDGLGLGALAGLALTAPAVIVLGSLVGGALAADATPIALLLVGVALASAGFTIVLSALGGYAGTVIE
ncbi:hypothetical protein SAMN06269185_0197 [Natronoarchaeum philippinense]|uniref:Uncharacterized protein n=1 Tax=Natronoarchaeum philippinense TaxID=558529 RepID=A0A285N110_NATPI|nr:DUF5518 domain-containing protein [Natronoarchaeum philippinense]SNZ03132.1 hypothetical protein SAMN06269185_0197 [Natronoarchaeum philippinense]